MKRVVLAIAAAAFLIAIGVMQASPALAEQQTPAMHVSQDEKTPPPPGVSPKDAAMDVPDGWRCPMCGATAPRHAGRGNAPYGRPELAPGWDGHAHGWAQGPGPNAGRPRAGRYGRNGDGSCFAEGPRRGMRGHLDGPGQRGAMRGHVESPGQRGGFDGMRGGNPAERLLRNADELKLTDDQVDRLEKLSYDAKKTLVDLHAEIEKEELEIQNLVRSGSDDLAAVKVHIAAVSQARAEIQTARIANLFEARKVLTEKQKKAIKEEFPRLGTLLD